MEEGAGRVQEERLEEDTRKLEWEYGERKVVEEGNDGKNSDRQNDSLTWFFPCHPGFNSPGTIVILPVGTTNARFKQRAEGYNMLGKFLVHMF